LGAVGGFNYLGKRYGFNGVEIVHASDIDPFAVETYNANFNHVASIADVRDLSFGRGFGDIVIGGFPCQAFSTVNPTKRPDAKENQLFWEMARIVQQVRPRAFVAENVKGFYRLEEGKYFRLAKAKFEALGYRVYHSLLNAADYGVPQLRERLIMVGIRADLKGEFHFPEPILGPRSRNGNPYVPLGAVVQSLIPPEERFYFSRRAVEGVKRAKPNMKRAVAQDLTRPCLTITSHLAKVSLNSRDPVLLVNPRKELYRRFTPREAASIQSFPDSFELVGSDTRAYKQIGNAVPPVLMWHVFSALRKFLEKASVKTETKNDLLRRRIRPEADV
jgi:DNA (cytosine-5)-methyltransferase 1